MAVLSIYNIIGCFTAVFNTLLLSDVPNVVVIITDGQSNVEHELTIPEARALKSDGVTILTVAVGFTSETSELSGLTSPPVADNLIYVEDYAGLAKLKDKLIEPLCTSMPSLSFFLYSVLSHDRCVFFNCLMGLKNNLFLYLQDFC